MTAEEAWKKFHELMELGLSRQAYEFINDCVRAEEE